MPRLHLVADVIIHYEEMIQNLPVRSINAKNIGHPKKTKEEAIGFRHSTSCLQSFLGKKQGVTTIFPSKACHPRTYRQKFNTFELL